MVRKYHNELFISTNSVSNRSFIILVHMPISQNVTLQLFFGFAIAFDDTIEMAFDGTTGTANSNMMLTRLSN